MAVIFIFKFLVALSLNENLFCVTIESATDPWRARIINLVRESQKPPNCTMLSTLPRLCIDEMTKLEQSIKNLQDPIKRATYHGWLKALNEKISGSKITDTEYRKACAGQEYDSAKRTSKEFELLKATAECRGKIQGMLVPMTPKTREERSNSSKAYEDIINSARPQTGVPQRGETQ